MWQETKILKFHKCRIFTYHSPNIVYWEIMSAPHEKLEGAKIMGKHRILKIYSGLEVKNKWLNSKLFYRDHDIT